MDWIVNYSNLHDIGSAARRLMLEALMPQVLVEEIKKAYRELSEGDSTDVAVRSSATAEDLPDASFAGQHESYLNVKGEDAVVQVVQNVMHPCLLSRAIKYREDKGFEHDKVAISVAFKKWFGPIKHLQELYLHWNQNPVSVISYISVESGD